MEKVKSLMRPRLVLVALILILVTTGCIGHRSGVSWADLTLVGDQQNILVSYNDYMVLIDPATGQPVALRNSDGEVRTDENGEPRSWEFQSEGSEFFTTPLFIDGEDEDMLVADYNNRLLTVNFPNARLGTGVPTEISGHVIADIVRDENRLFVPLMEQNLLALDYDTREQLWEFETERGVWASPLVVDGMVYLPSLEHNLYALDVETGDLVWTLNLGGAIAHQPVFYEDRLFVGTFNHDIYEISLDGEILSEFEASDWVWGAPKVIDGILYATDLSGTVYALDAENGLEQIWRNRASGDGIRPAPLVTESFVIIGDRGGRVVWLDRLTGETRFEQEVDAEILSDILLIEPTETLAIPDSLVIVSTVNNSRILVAFTLENGERRWVYER